ncbi:nuclease-related domain-containing protein [Cytobacillus sp. NCCP-133]|uniref:nuclease-related domain-containing protein n=1 Tax=Cytobacillus sp. NCCP-133 TaxID=766848 RepID=UPI00222E0C7B|nr:nuclease-related domain-containing protein [Cytobacillus sp. NCCP-133]GLB59799.1 nuclease [Cytobacillus sp. NCCP-133]
MIVKKRTLPLKILKNNALLLRLPPDNSNIPDIKTDLAKRMAGYRGEQSLDFHLSKLSEKDYYVFHGVRLTNGKYYFQIDSLILTASFALILEVKNYSGVLYFDPVCNQLIQRNAAGEEKGYANPIEQANQQMKELRKWFNKRNINLPIEFLVLISKPSTIIKTEPSFARSLQKVKHVQFLNSEIQRFRQFYNERFDTKELRRICRQITKEHQTENLDILACYKISFSEIKTGIVCPSCYSLPMKRHFAMWYCPKCKTTDRDAHYQAVIDLFLLNNDVPASNQDFRDFFNLSSRSITVKLLHSLNIPHTGTNKGRRYHPPPNYQNITDLNSSTTKPPQ